MKRLLILGVAVLATGCGQRYQQAAPETEVEARCRYEADKATAAIDDGWRRSAERRRVMESCYRAL